MYLLRIELRQYNAGIDKKCSWPVSPREIPQPLTGAQGRGRPLFLVTNYQIIGPSTVTWIFQKESEQTVAPRLQTCCSSDRFDFQHTFKTISRDFKYWRLLKEIIIITFGCFFWRVYIQNSLCYYCGNSLSGELLERYYFWFCHCLPPSLSASNVNLSEMEKPSCYHWVSRIRERKKKSQQDNERNVGLNVTGQQSNVSTFGFTVTKEK